MALRREIVDSQGRWIVVEGERCVECRKDSREIHPAGVVPGRWKCSCGRVQSDEGQVVSRVRGGS